jgi:hypothetical protein
MKKAFIRGLWGIYERGDDLVERRFKMDHDIANTVKNKHAPPSITYVYGEENYKYLKSMGVEDLKLVSKDPYQFDLKTHQYRHKIELYKIAMEEYDEIIYIDWDCTATKKLPIDFWDSFAKKEYCQANLQQYKRRKCQWRKEDTRKLPNGGFLYIRDKAFTDEIIDCWENKVKTNSDEPAIARAMDIRSGGWMGTEKYWELHEPIHCNLWAFSAFSKKRLKKKKKDICFTHYQGMPSSRYVNRKKKK